MPTTTLGKWSVGFAIAFILLLAVFMAIAASGETGGNTFSDNLWLAIPGLLADAAGILAFLTSLVAIVRNIDRSTLVCVAFALGFVITTFTLGEVLFPH